MKRKAQLNLSKTRKAEKLVKIRNLSEKITNQTTPTININTCLSLVNTRGRAVGLITAFFALKYNILH